MLKLNLLSKIKLKSSHPKQPFIYAVTAGKYLGELLVYIEKEKDNFVFLTLPKMDIRYIPIDKFTIGLENKIVDVVEKLPSHVHKTCLQQYKKNKATIAFKAIED